MKLCEYDTTSQRRTRWTTHLRTSSRVRRLRVRLRRSLPLRGLFPRGRAVRKESGPFTRGLVPNCRRPEKGPEGRGSKTRAQLPVPSLSITHLRSSARNPRRRARRGRSSCRTRRTSARVLPLLPGLYPSRRARGEGGGKGERETVGEHRHRAVERNGNKTGEGVRDSPPVPNDGVPPDCFFIMPPPPNCIDSPSTRRRSRPPRPRRPRPPPVRPAPRKDGSLPRRGR